MHRRVTSPPPTAVEAQVKARVKRLLGTPLVPANEQAAALNQLFVGARDAAHARALLAAVPTANEHSALCGYVFREGDIAYNCRTCQADPTCVLCQPCFEDSNHEGALFVPCEAPCHSTRVPCAPNCLATPHGSPVVRVSRAAVSLCSRP